MPLVPRLEDQVPGIANHNGLPEQCPHAAFKYKAIFVLAMMSVHGSCQSTWLHRMLDKRKTFPGVRPFDHKAGAGAPQYCQITITGAEYCWCYHGSPASL